MYVVVCELVAKKIGLRSDVIVDFLRNAIRSFPVNGDFLMDKNILIEVGGVKNKISL